MYNRIGPKSTKYATAQKNQKKKKPNKSPLGVGYAPPIT